MSDKKEYTFIFQDVEHQSQDKIPQLNSYNVNRILVWDKSLLNLINDNLNLKNKDIAEKILKELL
jgi:hypothetical protein